MVDTAKHTAYKNKFLKENYDRINLCVPKGYKETIQSHATKHGESVNAFVNRSIDETIERDTKNETH